MSGEQEVAKFIAEAKTNQTLRGDLQLVGNDIPAIVDFANVKGFKFSVNDLESYARKVIENQGGTVDSSDTSKSFIIQCIA